MIKCEGKYWPCHVVKRCNVPNSASGTCACADVVEPSAVSPHKRDEALAALARSDAELLDEPAAHVTSDNAAIEAAEMRKLDGQREALRRSLEAFLARPTGTARETHEGGLRGYQDSVVMDLLDRAGALG